MIKKHANILTLVIVFGFLLIYIMPGFLSGRESSTDDKIKRLEESNEALQHELTRLRDVDEIQKLQGRYESIHSSDGHLTYMLFADRPDSTYEITFNKLVGYDAIKESCLSKAPGARTAGSGAAGGGPSATGAAGGGPSASGAAAFAGMAGMGSMNPNTSSLRAIGAHGTKFAVHPIATPCIEVAADGKTAKATFTSLGMEGNMWCYGKYANDYIKIDGEWYIWHLKWLRCYKTSYYECWSDQTNEEIYEFATFDENGLLQIDESLKYNYLLAQGKEFKSIPAPKPYETWTEEDENGGWWNRDVVEP